MRAHAFSLIALLGLAASSAYAAGGDASDQFLDAFLNFQRGEKAETSGNARGALSAYNKAIDILDGISGRWPDWNPAIVKHRREKAAEAVSRLQPAARGSGSQRPTASLPVEPELPSSGNDAVLPSDTSFPSPEPPVRSSNRRGSKESGDPIQEIQSRIKSLQEDLTATRDRLNKATQDKEDLAEKYNKALKDAKEATEKMEVLQKRADRAESALIDAEHSGTKSSADMDALRKESAAAKKALRQLQIERDAEMELNEQFAGRINASRNQLSSTSTERDTAKKENAAMRKQLDEVTKTKTDLETKLGKAQDELSKTSTERDTFKKENAAVPKKIAEMQKQLDAVIHEKGDLETKLSKVQEQLTKVSGERDEAVAQLTKMKEAAKNVDKLLAENTQLMTKLQDAQKQITTFKAEGAEKDKKIADLNKELTSTRTQLADVQKQSAQYQTQMDELRQQLETQAKELTAVKTEASAGIAERKKLSEENDLLRGIVLRQQKEQARRDRVKKLVLDQLGKLEVHSKALVEQVELLGSPIVKLSDKERKLFKEPQLSISDSELTFTAVDATTSAQATPAEPAPAPAPDPAPIAETAPAPQPSVTTTAPTPASKTAKETKAKAPDTTPTPEPAAPAPETKVADAQPSGNFALDALPDITLGSGKSEKKTELASARTTTVTSSAPSGRSSIEGDLPAKEKGSGSIGGGPSVKTGLDPAVPEDLVGLARDAKDQFERGNYREAEKIYEKALAKAPNNLYVLSNLGVVRFRQSKYKLAEEAFKKAIAVAPEDDFSHCTLGIVSYQQQKFDDAIQSLTRALAINPKNPTAHNYLGITASQKGWQEAAQKELETAVAIDPNYADAHFNLAVVFATQSPSNKDEARKHYKRAVELGAEPDSALEQLLK